MTVDEQASEVKENGKKQISSEIIKVIELMIHSRFSSDTPFPFSTNERSVDYCVSKVFKFMKKRE